MTEISELDQSKISSTNSEVGTPSASDIDKALNGIDAIGRGREKIDGKVKEVDSVVTKSMKAVLANFENMELSPSIYNEHPANNIIDSSGNILGGLEVYVPYGPGEPRVIRVAGYLGSITNNDRVLALSDTTFELPFNKDFRAADIASQVETIVTRLIEISNENKQKDQEEPGDAEAETFFSIFMTPKDASLLNSSLASEQIRQRLTATGEFQVEDVARLQSMLSVNESGSTLNLNPKMRKMLSKVIEGAVKAGEGNGQDLAELSIKLESEK